MSNIKCPRDQGPCTVSKVPCVGEVGLSQIATGVMELKGKDERMISQEVLVFSIQGLQLGHTHREGYLVCNWNQKNQNGTKSQLFHSHILQAPTDWLGLYLSLSPTFLCPGLFAPPPLKAGYIFLFLVQASLPTSCPMPDWPCSSLSPYQ